MPHEYTVICVLWHDASYQEECDSVDRLPGPCVLLSSGVLISKSKHEIVMVGDLDLGDSSMRQVTHIPRKMIIWTKEWRVRA